MRHRRIRKPRPAGEINVTPLIDVVMCLVIFYLMVGKLAGDRRAHVDLPDTRTGTEARTETVVVNVVPATGAGWPAPGAQVLVERRPIESAQALEQIVRDRLSSRPGTVVQLRVEKELTWDMVAPVLRTCSRAGAKDVQLAADKAAPGGGGGR
jgi:biopolymer transport protein ExbD